jgi:hypothetical protein
MALIQTSLNHRVRAYYPEAEHYVQWRNEDLPDRVADVPDDVAETLVAEKSHISHYEGDVDVDDESDAGSESDVEPEIADADDDGAETGVVEARAAKAVSDSDDDGDSDDAGLEDGGAVE